MSLALAPAPGGGQIIAPWVDGADLTVTGATDTQKDNAAQAASELLWMLSGRQFPGRRTTTIRLLAPQCSCDTVNPAGRRIDGELARWISLYGGCGCARTVLLPDPYVIEVLSVTLDGTVLSPGSYELEDRQRLVRLDGAWPLGSDADRDRLVVTYAHGQDPPAGGVRAATALATSWLKQTVAGKCGIPSRTTQVTAEGVTIVFDDLDTFRQGGTGVSEADVWLVAVNPSRLTRRSSVLSPDSLRAAREST